MNQNNSKREASGFSIYNLNESLITIKSNENDNFFLSHYLFQIIKTKKQNHSNRLETKAIPQYKRKAIRNEF